MYLGTKQMSRTDRVANNTIRALAQQLVALTDEVERLNTIIEEMRGDRK